MDRNQVDTPYSWPMCDGNPSGEGTKDNMVIIEPEMTKTCANMFTGHGREN